MRNAVVRTALLLVGSSLGLACSVTTNGSTADTSSPSQPGASAHAGAATDATDAKLGFLPSNISLDGIDLSKVGDFVVDSATCTFHTESKEAGCGNPDALAFAVVTQPDASKIGVYVAKSIRVEPNARLGFRGTYGAAIVALDTFEVLGAIDVGADTSYASAGGFTAPPQEESKGGGPGGGGGGTKTSGGAGGSFCGKGGNGAATKDGVVSEPGDVYGNASLIPLIGGSAGGTAALGYNSGTGGGALQLVAGKSLRVAASGTISSGGGGGAWWGGADSQHASGGGSGGAILIESPEVVVAGIIAANGGGGGAEQFGKNGGASVTAALGSPGPDGAKGGDGSASDTPRGGDGIWVPLHNAGGGGGGAGRIRINTVEGKATITGKLSPALASSCATEGKLGAAN